MESSPDTIERKAINTSGRLGSLYDASRDRLLHVSSVKSFENPQFDRHSDCQVLQGEPSNGPINLLKAIKFDDALLQSILLGLVEPSGISSLINYNQLINENTRFLYYSYTCREEKLPITAAGKADKTVSLPTNLNNATHMITKIRWGFEILCVIQNSNSQSANTIEELLYQISIRLQDCSKSLKLSDHEERQLRELTDVIIFGSATCVDNPSTSLLTILTRIHDWQENTNVHHPTLYTLQPLKWLYKNQSFLAFHHLSEQDHSSIAQIEPIITYLNDCFKNLQPMFKNIPKNIVDCANNRTLKDIPEQFGILLSIYEEFRTKLRNIVIDVRQGARQSIQISDTILDKRYSSLAKFEIHVFYSEAQQWLENIRLIERLNNDTITYTNVLDPLQHQNIYLKIEDIDTELKDYFSKSNTPVILWYSSYRLKREKRDEWEQVYRQLTSERQQQTTQRTSLIYIDFSQCSQKLENFTIRRLPMQSSSSESRHNHPRVHRSPSVSHEEPSSTSLLLLQNSSSSTSSLRVQRSPPSKTEINVLMLGESGVGKSTFINAFVNYLMFDTLQQAEQSEPVVLIPVSFLTTIGDQFDEFTVKFGNVDANEDHEHQGQSVTQHCKSYVFDLNDRLVLRLIDTPGMGDTRGVTQDAKNIDHISTYVNNLSHLNAVCLLLKPNASQLNIFFRSCLNQLFTYLTPIGYNNIIFCFTNARATFFAPGNTGRLLRQLLKQEAFDGIQFQKENTFCFDSESFRYLAARKCGVTFDDFQKHECTNSWTTSVTESVRLLRFILIQKPYCLDEWQSPRKVALEISMLARPLMETLRLILYNWKLHEVGLVDRAMILNSNPVTIEMCSNCAALNIAQVGSYYIVEYETDQSKTVKHCQCPSDEEHFLIESTIKHDFVSQPINLSIDELKTSFRDVLAQCDRITHFLRQKEVLNQNDPFKSILEQFLEEEQYISDKIKSNLNMNKRIKETLRSIKQIRQQNKQQLIESNETLSVKDIYRIINRLKTIPAVNQQLESIRTSRYLKIEANEYRVKLPSIKNKIFGELTNSIQ